MKTTRLIPSLLIATLLLTQTVHAQQRRRQQQQGRNNNNVAMPERVVPVAPRAVQPPAQPVERASEAKDAPDAVALPAKEAAPANAIPAPASEAAVASKEPPTAIKGGVLLNFQGASLTDVLNYLSEAAGFIIVQDVPVSGTVNVVSKQPVSPDEAVDLLNTVLAEKGYTAIRSERILKIVNRKDALKKDLPVRMGSNPDQIPRKDEMVTQILPLRSGEAAKLIENLRPLLPDNSNMSANESSNSIIMTDTLTNIRRIAQIIQAIDSSVLGISTIHIYPLQFADSKELATVVTQLFSPTSTQGGGRGGRGSGGGGNPFSGLFGGPGGPGGGGGGQPSSPQSEAKQAESRVVAVADEQSNSLVVSASDNLIPMITDVVLKLDTSGAEVSETKIFRLLHADSVELATIITTLYSDTSNQRGQSGQNNPFGGRGGGFPFGQPQQTNSSAQKSSRSLQQAKVTAVGDPRTNSLLISAARDTIMSIAELVGRLDASDSKKQKVYYHPLTHADADNVANVLRGMLGDQNAISNTSQAGRLQNRQTNGATMDTTEFSGSNSGRGGGGGGSR